MSDSARNAEDYRVVVAEDEPLIRGNIARKIDGCGCGFTVVGSAPDGESALGMIDSQAASVLVTDIRMPGMDGLALIEKVATTHPNVQIIIVSGHDEFEYARAAIRFAVHDYLLKPVRDGELREALSRARERLDGVRVRDKDLYSRLRTTRLPSEAAHQLQLFIQGHFTERVDIRKAAEALNINYSSVGRMFKRHIGMSPLQYVMTLRTGRAKQLLAEVPAIDIRTISEMVGYEDQGYFTRMFRMHEGITPTEYRDGIRRR